MKTVTYTTMHFTIAFSVAWLLTGDILVDGLVATVEPAINSVAYVVHEKLWRRRELRRQQLQPTPAQHCLTC